MKTWLCGGAVAFALVASLPGIVVAQEGRDRGRGVRGLFESRPGAEQSQTLDFSLSLLGAYDDNALDESEPDEPNRRLQVEGLSSVLRADLAYARPGDRLAINVDGSSSMSHYPNASGRPAASASLRGNLDAVMGGTTLRLRQGASYSPFYGLAIGPRALAAANGIGAEPSALDFWVRSQDVYRLDASVAIEQAVGPRTTLGISGDYQRTEFAENGVTSGRWADLESLGAGVRVSRGMTRYASLRMGYSYREGRYALGQGDTPILATHGIDAGVDYRRALSISRRTSLTFSTGSGLVARDEGERESGARRLAAHLLVNATLAREMGRTWSANVSYARDLQYVDGFARPFLGDRATASLGGTFNRRVDSQLATSYSKGTIGTTGSLGYASWAGTADMRVALARQAALVVRYVYHHHAFDDGTPLPPDFPPRLDRHGVRLGLSLWLPFI